MQCVGRTQNFWMLNLEVHSVTSGVWGLSVNRFDLRSGCTLWSHNGTRNQMCWWLARCMDCRSLSELYGMAEQVRHNRVGCYRWNGEVSSMTHQHRGHWNINWKLLVLSLPLLSSEYIFWETLLFKRTVLTDKRQYYNCVLQVYPSVIISQQKLILPFSLFHRAFFNSIMDKTPTHALFTQHYISLACWFH